MTAHKQAMALAQQVLKDAGFVDVEVYDNGVLDFGRRYSFGVLVHGPSVERMFDEGVDGPPEVR